ncbi:MAG: hypothetical protein HQL12_01625 [Candidatus Omnitrophica bacterium]|nr:hypothetical protein [Candidatus Omnitrophota bacterium]
MERILLVFICMCLVAGNIPYVRAQTSIFTLDPHLLNWVKFNISPVTHLPYSFYIPENDKPEIYRRMESSGALKGTIERMITHEGMDIYDGALYQIVLSMTGSEENLIEASLADHYYWQGSVGDTWNIRAGYPINTFVYDPKNPESVSSDISRLGKRGFIFRIIDADGNYLVTDPLDGKKSLAGFPDNDRLHWVDWKPVAGENAWVVIAAMQIYHKKYYDLATGLYSQHSDSVELKLSRELARAAMILQSESGGIRMAPLGTYRNLKDEEKKDFNEKDWWYRHISTENNISWYAAFRMLYQVTRDPQYKKAMDAIERYLRFVWDEKQGLFYQGAYFINGRWVISNENFALDVQTWGLACIGPKNLDEWFGSGSAWRIWQAGRKHSGFFDKQGNLLGVGFTDEHDRISVEWSAGAMTALTELADYYKVRNLSWAIQALGDKFSMRKSMESLHVDISKSLAAYSYSSRRGDIPFGWNSHDPQVMSLSSTGWMIFVDAGFNPFWLV